MTDARDKQNNSSERARKVRIALAIVLALLILLLISTAYLLFQVLTPPGAKKAAGRVPGMQWIRSIYGYGTAADAQLLGPNDAAIAPDGTIWVTDTQRGRMIGFNPDGTYRTMIHQGPPGSSPKALVRPSGTDIDDNGLVYVADYSRNLVSVYTEDNKLVREWQVPLPVEVAVSEDRVAVATVNGIALFSKDGELITLLGKRGTDEEEFDNPRGIVFGEDGTLYVADSLNNRLKAITRDGATKWVKKYGPAKKSEYEAASTRGTPRGKLQMPSGMTMDASGRLVAVDPFELQIIVISPKDGHVIAKYGEFGDRDGQFLYPTGISYDPDRDWFAVADTSNDRVQIVRIKGSGGGLLAALRRALVGPAWVCGIPLFLLIIAVIIIVMRRRKEEAANRAKVSEEIVSDFEENSVARA